MGDTALGMARPALSDAGTGPVGVETFSQTGTIYPVWVS